jgi:hypothetical protein
MAYSPINKRRPMITLYMIGFITLIFILELFLPIEEYGYFVPAKAFERPWTFVTAIFLHADFEHLFFNMFALFIFGTFLETRIDTKSYILLFLLSGIVGNVAYIFISSDPTIPGLGASGAIYGIMGCLAVLAPTAIVYFLSIPMPMFLAAIVWAVTEFAGIFVPSDIGHAAHFAGLLVGVIYGFYIKKTQEKELTIAQHFQHFIF